MEHRTTRLQVALRACRIRRLVVVALAVLAWLAGGPVLAQTGPAQVARVINGNTISVRLDGDRDTVRVTGVNTPETKHATRGVEPYGPEAADDTTARLTGATVRLDLDPVGDDTDAYGRLLRYVALASGENVNATLIRDGCPTAIRTFPYSWQRESLQLEAHARRAGRGYGAADDHGPRAGAEGASDPRRGDPGRTLRDPGATRDECRADEGAPRVRASYCGGCPVGRKVDGSSGRFDAGRGRIRI